VQLLFVICCVWPTFIFRIGRGPWWCFGFSNADLSDVLVAIHSLFLWADVLFRISTVELGYDVMSGTEYFVSL
jgi:hypothetical protein